MKKVLFSLAILVSSFSANAREPQCFQCACEYGADLHSYGASINGYRIKTVWYDLVLINSSTDEKVKLAPTFRSQYHNSDDEEQRAEVLRQCQEEMYSRLECGCK